MTSVLNVTSPRTESLNVTSVDAGTLKRIDRTLAGLDPGPRRLERNVAAGAVISSAAGPAARSALRSASSFAGEQKQ